MTGPVSYDLAGGIATITIDDGKVNVITIPLLADLRAALDQAETDGAVVILTGREGRFSAGFDLAVLLSSTTDSIDLLIGGFELSERLLSFPFPVVVACTGHAIAMGLFLVLSGDVRIGAEGAFKLVANEVAKGLPLPRGATEICRQRLTPAGFDRVTILSEEFAPGPEAIQVGILDRVVPATELAAAARAEAERLVTLNMPAHGATKLRARAASLAAIRSATEADEAELRPFVTPSS